MIAAPHRAGIVRGVAATLAAIVLGGAASVLSASATGATALPATTATVTKSVSARGSYAVVVTVSAPATAAVASLSVFVGSQAQRNVALAAGAGAVLAFHVQVRHRSFTVRSVSSGPIQIGVAAARQPAQSTPPPSTGANHGGGSTGASGASGSTGSTGSNGASGSIGATGSTGASGSTFLGPAAGPYHHLVWSDEFNGPAATPPNPANWTEDSFGGCGDGTLSTNTQSPANASLNGRGDLAITADGAPGYGAAQLDSSGHLAFRYGRLEARLRIPPGSGLCAAFWMSGDSSAPGPCFPQCGEIDILEGISPWPSTAFATLHGPAPAPDHTQQWQAQLQSATPLAGSFHTYGVIWRPGRITWTFDGVAYATATPGQLPPGAQWVFDGHPFHIMLDLAVGGWPGAPAGGAPFPATMNVDWVRLYT